MMTSSLCAAVLHLAIPVNVIPINPKVSILPHHYPDLTLPKSGNDKSKVTQNQHDE